MLLTAESSSCSTATHSAAAAAPGGLAQRDGAVHGAPDDPTIDKAILDALGSPKRRITGEPQLAELGLS
jgi:hypothetical protein